MNKSQILSGSILILMLASIFIIAFGVVRSLMLMFTMALILYLGAVLMLGDFKPWREWD